MDKWNLIIDVALCENCNNCVLAAKDEFVGNDFPGYTAPHPAQGPGVIRIERTVRGSVPRVDAAYRPTMCNHCDDAPCLKAGADGAVRKRADGIVIFDPVKAVGRRDLVDVCPHGAVIWNEERQLPQTWFFDAHLLDAGEPAPRCVGVCPTQAIQAVKISDEAMALRVRDEGLRHPMPELKPRVHYRNLHRIDSCFVAGSVSGPVGRRVECLDGAQVTLAPAGAAPAAGAGAGAAAGAGAGVPTVITDAFGDFRIDGLAPGSGAARVTITRQGFAAREIAFTLRAESLDLGDISLTAVSTDMIAII